MSKRAFFRMWYWIMDLISSNFVLLNYQNSILDTKLRRNKLNFAIASDSPLTQVQKSSQSLSSLRHARPRDNWWAGRRRHHSSSSSRTNHRSVCAPAFIPHAWVTSLSATMTLAGTSQLALGRGPGDKQLPNMTNNFLLIMIFYLSNNISLIRRLCKI